MKKKSQAVKPRLNPWLVVIIILLALVGFVVSSTINSKRVDDWRIAEINRWIDSAEKVAQSTNDTEAKNIIRFVRNHHDVVSPEKGGRTRRIGPAAKAEPSFNIVVLRPEDSAISQRWAYLGSQESGFAGYRPNDKIMSLKTYGSKMTPACKGINVLHEGGHAMAYLTHPAWHVEDSRTFCFDEETQNSLSCRLAQKIGGKAYDDYLATMIHRLQTTDKSAQREWIIQRSSTDPKVMEIFKPLSEEECGFWWVQMWVDAQFRMIDQNPAIKNKRGGRAYFLHCQVPRF